MNQVTVNGKTIQVPSGSTVSVINGRVLIDGKPYTYKPDPGKPCSIKIEWSGPLASLEVKGDNNVEVICGNVDGNVRADGSVQAKDVRGSVNAAGSVTCGDVGGNAQAMGSVHCGRIGGDASAMGSVHRR